MRTPNAKRVGKTYLSRFEIEHRGSVHDRYCPSCKAPRTLAIAMAHAQGKPKYLLQCAKCETTWVVNEPLGEKLGVFPDTPKDVLDSTALKDF